MEENLYPIYTENYSTELQLSETDTKSYPREFASRFRKMEKRIKNIWYRDSPRPDSITLTLALATAFFVIVVVVLMSINLDSTERLRLIFYPTLNATYSCDSSHQVYKLFCTNEDSAVNPVCASMIHGVIKLAGTSKMHESQSLGNFTKEFTQLLLSDPDIIAARSSATRLYFSLIPHGACPGWMADSGTVRFCEPAVKELGLFVCGTIGF